MEQLCTRCHVVQKAKNFEIESLELCNKCITPQDKYVYLVEPFLHPMKDLDLRMKRRVLKSVMKDHKKKLYNERIRKLAKEADEKMELLLKMYGGVFSCGQIN